MKSWLASLEENFGVKEWDRMCTREFRASNAEIVGEGRVLVVLPVLRDAVTGTDGTLRQVVGNGW